MKLYKKSSRSGLAAKTNGAELSDARRRSAKSDPLKKPLLLCLIDPPAVAEAEL